MFYDIGDIKVLLCRKSIDMRKSINGLSILISDVFGLNPISRYIFVFCNKSKNKLKTLYWDRNGFVLCYKRLEKERFKLPETQEGVIEITAQQLRWILDGLDITKVEGHKKYHYKNHF